MKSRIVLDVESIKGHKLSETKDKEKLEKSFLIFTKEIALGIAKGFSNKRIKGKVTYFLDNDKQ
jgi:hypothetical protein